MKSDKKITLLVVTFNRSFCIERLLKYYVSRGFDQNIIVADASDSEFVLKNKQIYKSVEKSLSLSVKFLNGYSVIECLDSILNEVNTKYAVLNPDDDFHIPSSLSKMTKFLDDNPSYAGVNGDAISQVEENIVNNKIIVKGTGPYTMRGIYGKNSIERSDNLLKNYFGVLFAVFKTEVLKSAYSSVPGEGVFANELIPAYRAASIGNIGHINLLYLVRSCHENRLYTPPLSQLILEPLWSDNINLFREDFNRFNGLNNESGEHLLNFDKIMAKYFSNSFKKNNTNSFFYNFTILIKKILNLNKLFMIKGYRNPFYTGSKEISFIVDAVEGKLEEFK
jgi:glycosyltransferase domain-containing protein